MNTGGKIANLVDSGGLDLAVVEPDHAVDMLRWLAAACHARIDLLGSL